MEVFTAREFNQDLGKVKRAAAEAPVVITDHGKPSLVVMTHEAFEALQVKRPTFFDLLQDTSEAGNFDFDPDRSKVADDNEGAQAHAA